MRLALIGGEEFSDGFEEVHASLLQGAAKIVFLPTCAADDGPEAVGYWCTTAREKLGAFGASVETPRVIDAASANDEHHARLVAEADAIYLGGGYPHVAMRILQNTRVLDAIRDAAARGVLIAGASGGAMLMCARSWVIAPELSEAIGNFWESGVPPDWEPPEIHPLDCLAFVPRAVCSPHFNRVFTWKWIERGMIPPGFTLVGIDEQTALVSSPAPLNKGGERGDAWQVRGRGGVTLIGDDRSFNRFGAGETVDFRSFANFGSLEK